MFVAEHLRAAATQLYSGQPLTKQRLVGVIEPKLRPLGYRRHSLADECFGNSSAGVFSIADTLDTIVEIGDFVRIDGGACYPAETRCIRLSSAVTVVASALPSMVLAQKGLKIAFPALARITTEQLENVPEQTLTSWLNVRSLDYARFANETYSHSRVEYNGSAHGWKYFDISTSAWREVQQLTASKFVGLCRFTPEGISNYQYCIAHLRKDFSTLRCDDIFEILPIDARRVISGLHINSRKLRALPFRKRGNWLVANLSHFALPELLKVLRAISADAELKPDKRTEFWISHQFEKFLDGILVVFGMKPIFRS